ncbi:hypothetical protein Tco_1446307, partial [Tanacetum coccineum]
ADSINKAWEILDQIPGRGTGAYSHTVSLLILPMWDKPSQLNNIPLEG